MSTFNDYVEQYEKLQDDYGKALDKAYARGHARGQSDMADGVINSAPLSGEWASESVQELLGDIIKEAEKLLEEMGENEDGTGHEHATEEVCNQYETGYQDGNGRW